VNNDIFDKKIDWYLVSGDESFKKKLLKDCEISINKIKIIN